MNRNHKTAIALAVAALVISPTVFADDQIHNHTLNQTRNIVNNTDNDTTNDTTTNETTNTSTSNSTSDTSYSSSQTYDENYDFDWRQSVSQTYDENYDLDYDLDVVQRFVDVDENVDVDRNIDHDEHVVKVELDKRLSLDSDIALVGEIEVDGLIDVDSAAIAIIDNRQSITSNYGENELLENDASIGEEVASDASGNMGFNVTAGDNNAQDNAVALSAADASFAFGMADAEVFVNQLGADNWTGNSGVTNVASVGGNAFSNASGNMGVNVASGNNNAQKNALAAAVATTAIAQSSVSSNQVSNGNTVSNAGYTETRTETLDIRMSGTVRGETLGFGFGGYEGSSSGRYAGRGNAYQQTNFYPDDWSGDAHPAGSNLGHSDWDSATQGAVANPYRDGVGGIAFDTDEEGSYSGEESGELGFIEFGFADLEAQLSGQIVDTMLVAVNATNTASLSGNAFSGASGNIGVNVAAGTGNLQANSLALAVAQPTTGGGGGGGGE